MKNVSDNSLICLRCRTVHFAGEQICNDCKGELLLHYNHAISWKLAWEIEKEKENLRRMSTVSR